MITTMISKLSITIVYSTMGDHIQILPSIVNIYSNIPMITTMAPRFGPRNGAGSAGAFKADCTGTLPGNAMASVERSVGSSWGTKMKKQTCQRHQ